MGIKRPFVNLIFTVPVLFLVGCAHIEEITKDPEPKQISGVVSSVQYIAQSGSLGQQPTQKTIVTFQDGRIKSFDGLSDETFQKGKMNIISYNPEWQYIISVKIE